MKNIVDDAIARHKQNVADAAQRKIDSAKENEEIAILHRRERDREYYKTRKKKGLINTPRMKAQQKAYRERNKEKVAKLTKDWRINNREHYNEYCKLYLRKKRAAAKAEKLETLKTNI